MMHTLLAPVVIVLGVVLLFVGFLIFTLRSPEDPTPWEDLNTAVERRATRQCPTLNQGSVATIIIGPFLDREDQDYRTDLEIPAHRVELWKFDPGLWGNQRTWKHEPSVCLSNGLGMYLCKLDEVDTNTRGMCSVTIEMPGCLPVENRFEVLDALDRVWRVGIELGVYKTLMREEELKGVKDDTVTITVKGDHGTLADWWCTVPSAAEPINEQYSVPIVVVDEYDPENDIHNRVLADLWKALQGKAGKTYLDRIMRNTDETKDEKNPED